MGFLVRGVVTAVAIAITTWIINYFAPDAMRWGLVDYGLGETGRYLSLFLTAVALGLVNALVRPVLLVVSLPITCATLGLFVFVINALMLVLVSLIPQLGFYIRDFWAAVVAAVLISVVSGALSRVVR